MKRERDRDRDSENTETEPMDSFLSVKQELDLLARKLSEP